MACISGLRWRTPGDAALEWKTALTPRFREDLGLGYEYQRRVKDVSHEQALEGLRRIAPVPVVDGEADVFSPDAVSTIFGALERLGVPAEEWDVPAERYAAYVKEAGYAKRFPTYALGNLAEKSFEHFAAVELLELEPRDLLVDVASERSPLPLIAAELRGCSAFGQDYMYPREITDRCPYDTSIAAGRPATRWYWWRRRARVRWFGGDACAMELAGGSVTKAALTCSLEHFEGASDAALFRELARVIRPTGRVLIIPLYLSPEPFTQTDPTYSCDGDVPFDPGGTIRAVRGWGNRHGRFYSPETLRERILDPVSRWFDFRVLRLRGLERIPGNLYARFALLARRNCKVWCASSR